MTRVTEQLGLSFFQRSYLAFQPLQFPVNVGKLRLSLAVPQIVGATPFADQSFHLSAEKPQPRVAVHGLLLAMELARADRSDDFIPRQSGLREFSVSVAGKRRFVPG